MTVEEYLELLLAMQAGHQVEARPLYRDAGEWITCGQITKPNFALFEYRIKTKPPATAGVADSR